MEEGDVSGKKQCNRKIKVVLYFLKYVALVFRGKIKWKREITENGMERYLKAHNYESFNGSF